MTALGASVLTTGSGKLTGLLEPDGSHLFDAIPYAAPPVGKLRFAPPAPPLPWSGVRPVSGPGPAAPQRQTFAVVGEVYRSRLPQSEDCLTLSVRTPSPGRSGLPVFVWIHGGGFALGSGGDPLYRGGGLSRHGLVEVNVNYRLGALGFAALAEPSAAGSANAALLDVIASLRWVREEITAFGGDPDNVTLAGHSAGAMIVACLLASPHARGLVHRAVIASPGAPYAVSWDSAVEVTRRMADGLGIPRDSPGALRAVPLSSLLDAQTQLSDEAFAGSMREFFGGASMAFNPVIDGDVLPEDPLSALAQGAAAEIPLLVGNTRDEAVLHLETAIAAAAHDPALARGLLAGVLERFGPLGPAIESTYRRLYPQAPNERLAAAVLGDAALRYPAFALARAAADHSPVFCYRFDQPTIRDGRPIGAVHGAELPYLFDTGDTEAGQHLAGEVDAALAEQMRATWAAFAANGRPRPPKGEWPRHSARQPQTLAISTSGFSPVTEPPEPLAGLWLGAA
ncbi:para-nitrobenzyl esterase [Amycolatopsis bartoniae]|uniref:Carboxylic ester hydrolase n=1 Tax=Amycolatopsis bartoniae TaxID=941986 RepID=A0A8H9J251_9PSEU|nr:carboxylesterase family protein [Amycolatopsis bartoniae]MBB2939440.1 para-nitrobenzyl esterase [Amycolatopsis bartoniae]TVT11344.1 carboxylesterase family protein [Amycolatopsis bartoniae]GHF66891.1 carboxylic ester hydrolase [Amycolatopsis bartoniae]